MKKKQNLLKKNVKLLAIACVICSNIIAAPKVQPECDEVLHACLDYAKTLEVERQFLSDAVKRQQKTIETLEDKQSSQPWYVWVLIGAAGGLILTGGR